MTESAHSDSYRTILRSTSIVAAAQIANIVLGIVRMKALALMLGPTGVGLAGMYQSVTTLVGTVTRFGVNAAGVRQIAEAVASGDDLRLARSVRALRTISRLSGVLGMAILLVSAAPFARMTLGSDGHTADMALMALVVLFSGISVGQTALLQGLRQLKELALANVYGAVFGTISSIVLVFVLGEHGVAPFLVSVAGFGILTSWWYARQVSLQPVHMTHEDFRREARLLLTMGAGFVVSALCGAGVAWVSQVWIGRELGLPSVGLYSAASTLSSVYVGVVLGAMGADFYPRLTAVASDNSSLNRMVNEQSEMGLLIALPALLLSIVLAPWVLGLFYSKEFVEGTALMRWMVLGIGLRVISWPLGYVQLAKGKAKVFMATEILFSVAQIIFLMACIRPLGLEGCGIAFLMNYVLYTGGMLIVCRRLTGFRWSKGTTCLVALGATAACLAMSVAELCSQGIAFWIGWVMFLAVAGVCLGRIKHLLRIHSLHDLHGVMRHLKPDGYLEPKHHAKKGRGQC